MNERYSCENPCKNWGVPDQRPCSNRIKFNDMQKTGPEFTGCCTCAYQGNTPQGIPKYGYYKPVSLPYVNYQCDEQRSPYDSNC